MSAVLQALQQPLDTASPGPALDEARLLARAQALIAELAALAEAHDASGAAPAPQFALLHQADLLRLTIAREAGGHGAGLASARAVVGAIAQGDPAVALILAMHYSNHAAIARSQRAAQGEWPAALADELIAASLQGPALLNAAQVEPELGSPSHGGLPAARARRVAGGWQLSGHKVYVTGGPLLAWISVLAVTDEPEPRLGSFVLPRDTAGARLLDTWNPMGMRATVSQDLVLDGAWVPDHHAVGLRPASLGLQREAHGIAWYFSLVATVYDGAARSARDWLGAFLNQRRPSALARLSCCCRPVTGCWTAMPAPTTAALPPMAWSPWPSMCRWTTHCAWCSWRWSWPATTAWRGAIRWSAICAMCCAARSIRRPTA